MALLLTGRITHNNKVLVEKKHGDFQKLQAWLLIQLEKYCRRCCGEIIQQNSNKVLGRYRVSAID
jgi:hypothetical protein